MKKVFNIYCLILSALLVNTSVSAQGITIGSGTTFSLGSSTLTLSGNWNNSGTFNAENGTVIFAGPTGTQSISNTTGEIFNNLTVNKAAGDVQLESNVTVNGTLNLTSGDINLNSNTLTLGSSALLSESAGNTVKGSGGSLTTTRNLTTSFNLMGIEITSSVDLGSTVITRGHTVQSYSGNNSILRYYDITPTTNTGLNASVVFHYDESELNSLAEGELLAFRSEDGGSSWSSIDGSTLNAGANTVSISGLSSLSRFTLAASSAPLPVELIHFSADAGGNIVKLTWATATEVNNYGFEIERNTPLNPLSRGDERGVWEKIGFVHGAGNSNSPKNYSFIDKTPLYGEYTYRLKQLDNDGKFKYSDEIKVTAGHKPSAFKMKNYPDPFNPVTTIMLEIPELSKVDVSVYNILGEKVATLFNGELEPGIYQNNFNGSSLTSGMYIMVLNTDRNVSFVKKIMLVK